MSVPSIANRAPSFRLPGLAVALLALGAILGAVLAGPAPADGWQWLHWVCKPLTTVVILGTTWRIRLPLSARYRSWIVVGMLFSLGGDIFLMLPQDAFVPGLVSFLIAHVCFIRALLDDARFAPRPLAFLACLGYGAINLWLLWPSLPPALYAPVMVYVAVLATMAGQAVSRAWWHGGDDLAGPARWAAVGALLFMLSDTLIAWNRFRLVIPLAALWILVTYYAALWCLARSVQRVSGAGNRR